MNRSLYRKATPEELAEQRKSAAPAPKPKPAKRLTPKKRAAK